MNSWRESPYPYFSYPLLQPNTNIINPQPQPPVYQMMTAEDRHFNIQPGSMYAATPAMAWQLPADLPLAQLPAVEPLTTATRAAHPIFPRLPPHNGPGFGVNQTMMVPGPAVSVTPNLDSFGPTSDPPFADPNRSVRPRNHGVIKIKNIPYGITMAEVHQFASKLVSEQHIVRMHKDGFPIHILMERSTGKTMDVFVEVTSPEIAQDAIDRSFRSMKCPKLGQRHVSLEASDQSQLMHEMFPRTRCILWDPDNAGCPVQVPNNDKYSSGFKSFLTDEELNGMVRHAETPQRSPFASRSYQRTFECMISTLYKYPWYADDLYTMRDRDEIWKTYVRQLEVLVVKCGPGSNPSDRREVGLEYKLLLDFLFAGMNCPGFSERQKANFLEVSRGVGGGCGLSQYAAQWPFQTLSPHPPNVSEADLDHWLRVFNLGVGVALREIPADTPVALLPYVYLEWDNNGNIVVQATMEGLQLTRRQFAHVEKHFINKLIRKGWGEWFGNAIDDGCDSSGLDDDALFSTVNTSQGPLQAPANTGRPVLSVSSSGLGTEDLEIGLGNVQLHDTQETAVTQQQEASNGTGAQVDSRVTVNRRNLSQDAPSINNNAQDWNVGTTNELDPGFTTAFSGEGLGNGNIFSPPRISTARRASVTTATPGTKGRSQTSRSNLSISSATAPGSFTASAPTSAVRRENHALVIRNPDGTPIDLPVNSGSTFAEESTGTNAASSFSSAAGTSDPFSSGSISPLTTVKHGNVTGSKRHHTFSASSADEYSRHGSITETMTPTWSTRGSETGSPLRRRSNHGSQGLGHASTASLGRQRLGQTLTSSASEGNLSNVHINHNSTTMPTDETLEDMPSGITCPGRPPLTTSVANGPNPSLGDRSHGTSTSTLHGDSSAFHGPLAMTTTSLTMSPTRGLTDKSPSVSKQSTPSSAVRGGVSDTLSRAIRLPTTLGQASPIQIRNYGVGGGSPFRAPAWNASSTVRDTRVAASLRPDTITETSEDDIFH